MTIRAYDILLSYYKLHEAMKLIGVAENIKNMLFISMFQWKTILTTKGVKKVKIKHDIFQSNALKIKHDIFQISNALSLLLFIIVLISLTATLNNTKCDYSLSKETAYINQLLFMSDLKL